MFPLPGTADTAIVMQDIPVTAASPEEAFAARLRALDGDAWAELHDAHYQQLWRYVYARTGSRDLAEEVVQQVFAEGVASIRRYATGRKPILAWLYTIARNHTSKALRGRRREAPMPAALAVNPLDARLDSMALEAALSLLPESQREVLVLRFLAGYAAEEIARALGKTPTAVYSLQARALERMRGILETRRISVAADEFAPSRV